MANKAKQFNVGDVVQYSGTVECGRCGVSYGNFQAWIDSVLMSASTEEGIEGYVIACRCPQGHDDETVIADGDIKLLTCVARRG